MLVRSAQCLAFVLQNSAAEEKIYFCSFHHTRVSSSCRVSGLFMNETSRPCSNCFTQKSRDAVVPGAGRILYVLCSSKVLSLGESGAELKAGALRFAK
jgi:hypothetical protein